MLSCQFDSTIFVFSQKKIKMSTTDNLSVIPEVNDEENGILKDGAHRQPSPAKKSSKKLSKKSSNRDLIKQKDDKNGSTSDETRCIFTRNLSIRLCLDFLYIPFSNSKLPCVFGNFCARHLAEKISLTICCMLGDLIFWPFFWCFYLCFWIERCTFMKQQMGFHV